MVKAGPYFCAYWDRKANILPRRVLLERIWIRSFMLRVRRASMAVNRWLRAWVSGPIGVIRKLPGLSQSTVASAAARIYTGASMPR